MNPGRRKREIDWNDPLNSKHSCPEGAVEIPRAEFDAMLRKGQFTEAWSSGLFGAWGRMRDGRIMRAGITLKDKLHNARDMYALKAMVDQLGAAIKEAEQEDAADADL